MNSHEFDFFRFLTALASLVTSPVVAGCTASFLEDVDVNVEVDVDVDKALEIAMAAGVGLHFLSSSGMTCSIKMSRRTCKTSTKLTLNDASIEEGVVVAESCDVTQSSSPYRECLSIFSKTFSLASTAPKLSKVPREERDEDFGE